MKAWIQKMWRKLLESIRRRYPTPTPTPGPQPSGALAPRKIAHGSTTHVPLADKSNRPRGTEKIHHKGPFRDFRVLEIGDNAFLDSFILLAVREVDGHFVGDDMVRGDVVYVFDHWSVIYDKDNTPTNPLPLAGVSTRTFRAWWRCHRKAEVAPTTMRMEASRFGVHAKVT